MKFLHHRVIFLISAAVCQALTSATQNDGCIVGVNNCLTDETCQENDEGTFYCVTTITTSEFNGSNGNEDITISNNSTNNSTGTTVCTTLDQVCGEANEDGKCQENDEGTFYCVTTITTSEFNGSNGNEDITISNNSTNNSTGTTTQNDAVCTTLYQVCVEANKVGKCQKKVEDTFYCVITTEAAQEAEAAAETPPAETSPAETLAAATLAAATLAAETPPAAQAAAVTPPAAQAATATPAAAAAAAQAEVEIQAAASAQAAAATAAATAAAQAQAQGISVNSEVSSTDDSGADMTTIIGVVIGVAVAAIAVIAMLVARKKNSKENEKEIYLAQRDPYYIEGPSSVMAAPMLHPTFEQHPPTERITEGYHVRELSMADSSLMSFSDYSSDNNDSMMSGSEFSCKNSQVNDQNALPARTLGAMYYVENPTQSANESEFGESDSESFIEEEELAASEYDESEVVDGESFCSSEYEESELNQGGSIYSDVDGSLCSMGSSILMEPEFESDVQSFTAAGYSETDDQDYSQYSASEYDQSEGCATEDHAGGWGDESEFDDEESSDNGSSILSEDLEMSL